MKLALSLNEIRILGCLLEKAAVTPDQYPLTLNALTNACNQKSSRDPVMALDQGAVQRVARELEQKHLVVREENFNSRTEKYQQRLCNTPFADYQFSEAEYAVLCLLMLRGPQTPGELRSRSGRLHQFVDNDAVKETLQGLIDHDAGALVARLPRVIGRQDSEYIHLLSDANRAAALNPAQDNITSGPTDRESSTTTRNTHHISNSPLPENTSPRSEVPGLDERTSALEIRVAALEQKLAELQR